MSPISRPLSRAGLSQAYRQITNTPSSRWGAASFYQSSHIGDYDTISPCLYHKSPSQATQSSVDLRDTRGDRRFRLDLIRDFTFYLIAGPLTRA
jgi:hypothetical protein